MARIPWAKLSLFAAVLLASNVFAQNTPLTNESIIQMAKWKATPSEIKSLISRNAGNIQFSLTTEKLKDLVSSGVTDDVLDAMWKATLHEASPSFSSSASDAPPPSAPSNAAHSPEALATAQVVNAALQTTTITPTTPAAQTTAPATPASATGQAQGDTAIKAIQDNQAFAAAVKKAVEAEDPDFALVLGSGSLVVGTGVTDYVNESNVIRATNLGRATPQLMAGVSFRTHIPNFRNFQEDPDSCSALGKADATKPTCEIWRARPWSAFVSLKFAPGASQLLNGFVFGGTYSFARYISGFIGYSLSPINEPSPGFRTTASQFVTAEQTHGRSLNFDPNAMANNLQSAFDGFPLTDSTGKLIYQGNPLTVHYRGGAVFGVSIPIYFKSIFQK